MKKGLIALTAVIMVAGFALAAKAQATAPAAPQFTFNILSWVRGETFQRVDTDAAGEKLTGDFIDTRFRPDFTLSNGATKFVMRLEYDGCFGKNFNASYWSGAPVTSGQGPGASNTYSQTPISYAEYPKSNMTNLKLQRAYFETQVSAVPGLSLLIGQMNFDAAPFWYQQNAPAVGVNYVNGPVAVEFKYVKLYAGEVATTGGNATSFPDDDAGIWYINALITQDMYKVKPIFAVLQSDANGQLGNAKIKNGVGFIGGATANLNLGMFGADLFGAYASMKQGAETGTVTATAVQYSGYAADVDVWAKLDILKVTAFATFVSGDDGKSTTKKTNWTNFGLTAGSDDAGGLYRTIIFQNTSKYGQVSDTTGAALDFSSYGYNLYGLQAEAAVSPDLTLKVLGCYAQLNKAPTGIDTHAGMEFDFMAYYNLAAGTQLFFHTGYVVAGKAFDSYSATGGLGKIQFQPATTNTPALNKKQNPYAIALGSTYQM